MLAADRETNKYGRSKSFFSWFESFKSGSLCFNREYSFYHISKNEKKEKNDFFHAMVFKNLNSYFISGIPRSPYPSIFTVRW
jgi:hypothetical protein